jgi:hypothetical protein
MTVRIPRRLVIAIGVIAAAVLIGGLGAVAYQLGRSDGRGSINQGAIRTAAYNRGYSVGFGAGNSTGYLSGYSAGRQNGQAQGQAQGAQQGETQGQNDVFQGYSGGWTVGEWYIIKIGSGQAIGASGKYSIPTRVGPMVLGEEYGVCPDGSGDICSRAMTTG